MPPVIAAAQAIAAFTITVFGVELAVGSWIMATAFSVGVNMIFGSKPKLSDFERGISTQISTASNVSRKICYGTAKTGGSLAFGDETGTDNEYLWLVIALADHQSDSLAGVIVGDQEVTWDSGTGVVSEYTSGGTDHMEITFYDGSESQTADSALVTASTVWTSDHRLRGVTYVVVKLTWNQDLFSGIPRFEWVLNGRPLYDPRLDSTVSGGSGTHRYATPSTWEFGSDIGGNPALQLHDYLRGIELNSIRIGGMGIGADDVPLAQVMAAANVNDESVSLAAGGSELRYVSGLFLDTADTHRTNIEKILATMAGELHDHGGLLRMFSGEARTPVLTVTDDMIVRAVQVGDGEWAPAPFKYEPKRGRDELVNRVFGRYIEPGQLYNDLEYPARTSASYVTQDGGDDWDQQLDLIGVQSNTQGQRIAEIFLRRARWQGKLTFTGVPELIELEAGDWFTFSSSRFGWTGGNVKTFIAQTPTRNPDMTVSIVAQEIDSTVYDWTPGTDELTPKGATATTKPAIGSNYAAKFDTLASLAKVDTAEIEADAVTNADSTTATGVRSTSLFTTYTLVSHTQTLTAGSRAIVTMFINPSEILSSGVIGFNFTAPSGNRDVKLYLIRTVGGSPTDLESFDMALFIGTTPVAPPLYGWSEVYEDTGHGGGSVTYTLEMRSFTSGTTTLNSTSMAHGNVRRTVQVLEAKR